MRPGRGEGDGPWGGQQGRWKEVVGLKLSFKSFKKIC